MKSYTHLLLSFVLPAAAGTIPGPIYNCTCTCKVVLMEIHFIIFKYTFYHMII